MRNWIPVEAVFHAPEASVTARILHCRASLSSALDDIDVQWARDTLELGAEAVQAPPVQQ
ncbi:hypothetical protein T02_14296 [Trichinella nativa]|uniref:Uncharacterized protein n=4 Tax=Trichinella TaxID=6333 RepID=A0A0V1LJL7_9BILA|nr:hypothetical protein T02_14296 [Trichinella nativa]